MRQIDHEKVSKRLPRETLAVVAGERDALSGAAPERSPHRAEGAEIVSVSSSG